MGRKPSRVVLGVTAVAFVAFVVVVPLLPRNPIDAGASRLRVGMPLSEVRELFRGLPTKSGRTLTARDPAGKYTPLVRFSTAPARPGEEVGYIHEWRSGGVWVNVYFDGAEQATGWFVGRPPSPWERFKAWAGWGPPPVVQYPLSLP